MSDLTENEIVELCRRYWNPAHPTAFENMPAMIREVYRLGQGARTEALPTWPNPDDWNFVCPKCGATPDSSCGWTANCPTGLDKRPQPQHDEGAK